MTALVDGVVKLIKTEFGYDLLDTLMGFENAGKTLNVFLNHVSNILTGNKLRFIPYQIVINIITFSNQYSVLLCIN